ncbi:BglG family transcription antiterminator [Bacillus taeanensis]|uniref:PTS fructose transporter subunit IIA n=1 Tax=Bacillus taeanensis TaxID=273032 RepID=A0A366XRR1_9BACI|nr:BglG family transcription antiterminator [Bacillus taeanensis]RBW67815.1 PTS fructose transporter subunit IIA [Bacillus taeanensis]
MGNGRIISILRELMAAKSPLTSDYLASVNQVTSRTVRSDIKELDTLLSKHGAAIKSVRGTGYELTVQNEQLFRQLLQKLSDNDSAVQGILPSLPEERVQFLINRLLLTDQFVKLEELADELYISKSTIQNDLRDVKKILQNYGITLETRPNYGFRLKGEEAKLRYCMSEYLFDRTETELDLMNANLSILPKEEMKVIRAIILEQIKENDISLSDIGLNNLIIHIAIACKRIRNKNYVSLYPQELKNIINQKEYVVAANIVLEIERGLHVVFPQTEVAYIAIHLLGTKMIVDTDMSEKEIKTVINQEVYQLTISMLDTIETKLHLGIRHDKELLIGISLHLKPAINRYRYGMNLRNPMLDAIKSNYPLAFQAGVVAGMVIKRELGIEIHENEIGYLALHIGAAIERKNMGNEPKRCMIVCASGVGSSKLLYYKLKSKFGSKLEILGTTEYYKLHQTSLHALDFLISTIPIADSFSIPVIEVNTILGGHDLEKIEKIIVEQTSPPFEYTNEKLVFLQEKFETKEQVLHFLGDKLRTLGFVNETFIDSVFEREAVSPTCFGNLVAIPHPMIPQTDTTFWTICTLQKPIMWEDKHVQFVCLLSVQKNSTEDLQKMYKLLGKVVDDRSMVQQLLKCKSYQEFIEVFSN